MPTFSQFFTRRCFGLVLLAIGVVPFVRANEVGLPEINEFNVRDYLAHNQTWSAVQDRAGTLYVGNKDVVLTYDGHSWNSIATGGLFVRSLAVDDDDRIWLAGVGEFGYLEADAHGGRHYVSLRQHLPVDDQGTLPIFQCFVLRHGVYLISRSSVLRWHDGHLTETLRDRVLGWTMGDELWTHGPDAPVRMFDGQAWHEVIDAAEAGDHWVLFGTRLADSSVLLATRDDGIWRLSDGVVQPWSNEANAVLRERGLLSASQLRDGSLVISTRRAGTLVLELSGRVREVFDEANGALASNYTLNSFQDRSGDIWLLQNSGLARIQWPARVTRFDTRRGLGTGTVRTLLRHRGRLYVGTNEGLFVLVPSAVDDHDITSAHFTPIKGVSDRIWAIATAGDELLVSSIDGLLVLRGEAENPSIEPIHPQSGIISLMVPRDRTDQVWVGSSENLQLLQRGPDGWALQTSVPEVDQQVRTLVEDDTGALWVAAATNGYYRIMHGDDPRRRSVQHFAGGHGLPSERIDGLPGLALRGGQAVFLDQDRLFTFDAQSEQFVPLPSREPFPTTSDRTMPSVASGLDGALWVRTLRSDPDAGPWQGRVFSNVPPEGLSRALPFFAADSIGENPVFLEERTAEGSVVWIGGSEGLVRAELPAAFVKNIEFHAKLRRVARPQQDSVVRDGAPVEFPFHAQALSFVLGTDRLDDRRMRYQWRLTNLDDAWTPLSANPELSLNHLPAGTHRLAVRARDGDGRLSTTATFSFVVLPPWWQTWWARTGLIATLGLVFAALIRHRLGAVQRRNAQLESLVEARTRDLQHNEVQLMNARDAADAAREAADAANRAKSDFLASMSHELRTPLNAILGFAQILHRADGISPKSRQQLDIIDRNGRHLLGMINEVLDLSKIEAGKLTLNLSPTSLRALALELTEMFESRALEKGLRFRTDLDPQLTRVLADAPKLRQVLINLLANAVKFTTTGEITLTLRAAGSRIHFAVSDTGIGLSDTAMESIFAPFHQMIDPRANGSDTTGTGLGLPISQRLIELMGGHIAVDSTVDRGSRFHFDLDLPAAPETSDGLTESLRVTGYTGPKKQVLIVDDVAHNRDVLHEMLTMVGFDVTEADSGEAALQIQPRQPIDLVLLDLRLPGIQGAELAAALRAQAAKPLPIIAVSASVFDMDESRAGDFGCDAFIAKPVEEANLFATIGQHLGLTWQTESVAPRHASTTPFESAQPTAEVARMDLPPRDVLQAWLELASRSDQRRLREAINASAATGADAGFRRELDQRLQRFRTGEVSDILESALRGLDDSSASTP